MTTLDEFLSASPNLRFAFMVKVDVGPIQDLGVTSAGHRRVIDIRGGTVSGPRLSGTILPGGADWQVVRPGGAIDVEARYTIRADSGGLVYVRNWGVWVASAEVMANGLEIVLSDPAVQSVFVNVFGGITACDAVANGIVRSLALLAERGEVAGKPLVVRLDGNNAELGRRILDSSGNPLIERVDTMDGAARRAAELAASAASAVSDSRAVRGSDGA